MQCPQCASDLDPLSYEGVTVHACDTCGGEFLEADELRGLTRAAREGFSTEERRLLDERHPQPPIPAQTRRVRCCPGCGEPMDPVSFGGETGILVDRCGSCEGLWIDREELERIQVLRERFCERPPELASVTSTLETARRRAAERSGAAFSASRFALVNALISRFLDLE